MAKEMTGLQQQIMKIISSTSYPVVMSAAELGKIMVVAPHRLAGPLGGLRKRGLLKRTMACTVPLQIIHGPIYGRTGLEWREYIPRKRHYAAVSRMEFTKAFMKLRRDCVILYMRRYNNLTWNQQQQALIGNWNV